MKSACLAALMLFLVACDDSDDPKPDGGTPVDTGAAQDAETPDGGPVDSGETDSGTNDAGFEDAAAPDVQPSGQERLWTDGFIGNTDGRTCQNEQHLQPTLPLEAGHFAAIRIYPLEYPYRVTEILYQLSGAADCATGLEHAVDLYVSQNDAPTASPSQEGTLIRTLQVPTSTASTSTVTVSIPLSPPIELAQDDQLFVAIEMSPETSSVARLCVQMCGDDIAEEDLDYWSGAANEPYNWRDLVGDFGSSYNFTVRARGEVF